MCPGPQRRLSGPCFSCSLGVRGKRLSSAPPPASLWAGDPRTSDRTLHDTAEARLCNTRTSLETQRWAVQPDARKSPLTGDWKEAGRALCRGLCCLGRVCCFPPRDPVGDGGSSWGSLHGDETASGSFTHFCANDTDGVFCTPVGAVVIWHHLGS